MKIKIFRHSIYDLDFSYKDCKYFICAETLFKLWKIPSYTKIVYLNLRKNKSKFSNRYEHFCISDNDIYEIEIDKKYKAWITYDLKSFLIRKFPNGCYVSAEYYTKISARG